VPGADEEGTGTKRKQKNKNPKENKPKRQKKRRTAVYVTGLPLDTTLAEMDATFSKCGVILEDIETGEKKIKLYMDDNGNFKGDALVIYFKDASVKLACDLLHETELRYGCGVKMNVQPAEFQEKEGDDKKRRFERHFVKAKMSKFVRYHIWNFSIRMQEIKLGGR
jgi:HIV Tat-specific factor 1